ncbi:MAG: DUF1493 family protein [Candidatus Margulisiibacteriota bacterium]
MSTTEDRVIAIINDILEMKDLPQITYSPDLKLKEDIGLDSLDLAELTVKLEKEFSVDIFADAIVQTLGEVIGKL